MIRIGLLGAGFMGEAHAAAYAQLPSAKLTAVADRNRVTGEHLASQYSAKYFSEVDDLFDSGLCDAVDICLPTFLHESNFVAAAEYGLHVLCEKPIVISLEAMDRIILAARTAGIKAMVAQVIRFWPEYVVIRDTFRNGDVGKPKVVRATRLATLPYGAAGSGNRRSAAARCSIYTYMIWILPIPYLVNHLLCIA